MSNKDQWFYPDELSGDLRDTGLSPAQITETITAAWEYTRASIPEFTNWERYLAEVRFNAIAIVAECSGDLLDIASEGPVLGYDLDELIDTLFAGTPGHESMAREFRGALLFMQEKTSGRRDTLLWHRYANALAYSPRDWFRIRDCDGLARFTMAAALACNDIDTDWPQEEEFRFLAELVLILYDTVAFYKHRAEGEICNTWAYADPSLRQEVYGQFREALWALDTAWSRRPDRRCLTTFIRNVGGPIHMTMRRYRFVEDGLTIGEPETTQMVDYARRHAKLWYRLDAIPETDRADEPFHKIMTDKDRLLFDGFADMLKRPEEENCSHCHRQGVYGTDDLGQFSGVQLCSACLQDWTAYLTTFAARARGTLPLAFAKA
ncbi:hypothetical protein [Streptomyces sp. NPDC051546]|uniref:hypothetical protein n=1 Tax=Streptomyces sp. NPDC051546 TaxID=3365655 RepID=UPI0037A074DB